MTPTKIIFVSIVLLIVISTIMSFIGTKAPLLLLNENQVLYLYSTSAQVLAGVYGLTLTGFIFFRNELSREEFEDDTLTVAVDSLKDRYFKILLFVTILSIFTLLMSNLVLSTESEKGELLKPILMNVAQSSFVVNLLVIAYFIFDVIAPKRIEKESKSIQKVVDPIPEGDLNGSLEDFLSSFNQIEYIIQKYGQAYQSQIESQGKPRRRISNVRLAEFIFRAEKIDYALFEKIKNLITLRNSIIHGAEPVVSNHMVEQSKSILQELAKVLNVHI